MDHAHIMKDPIAILAGKLYLPCLMLGFGILASHAALTGTDRGTGTGSASSTTFTFSPASNFSAGTMAVLVIAADNPASGENFTSVTDTLGNTWTEQNTCVQDPAGAGAGVQGAFYTTLQNGGTLQTSTVITVTYGANTPAEAYTLMEVAPSGGNVVEFVTFGDGTGSSTSTPTVTTGTITNTNMVIGGLFNEQGTGQTVTEDGDTTNGTWSTQQTNEVGTTDTGMTVASQRKVVTSTATQTYNLTLGVASDVILGWIEVREVSGTSIKTVMGLAEASVKTVNDLANASVKTIMGLP